MLHVDRSRSDPERANGLTFSLDQVGFIDFETRGRLDLKAAGAYRYATEADAIIMTYAIGAAEVRAVTAFPFRGGRPLAFEDLPTEVLQHHAKVMTGTAVWAAWNSGFDKAIWNFAIDGMPELEPHHIIDVMAQASASGLPPDLDLASRIIGRQPKDKRGGELIKLFCTPGSVATERTHPDEWDEFIAYAVQDIEALRSVFRNTRQLPLAEWREFWAMEAINERGARIDLPMVTHAAKLAGEDRRRSNIELEGMTDGAVTSVDQVARLTGWLLERLPAGGRAILTKREEEVDEDGVLVKPAKHALTRGQVQALLAYVKEFEIADFKTIERVLQIRLYGGSKTPQKFSKMLQQHVDGGLFGQYVFNGAGQTGRASSRGVQVHNLARDTLPNEHDVIEQLLAGADYDTLLGNGTPVARQLALLIRPAFIAAPGNTLVWSDWSQIEARVLPWLCDHYAGARARLRIFTDVDKDPSLPDLYTRTAATLSRVPIDQVTKPMRQRGKVAELALGYMGGIGALQAMGAGYGLHLDDDEARRIVAGWREANQWARDFGNALWEAALVAHDLPGATQPVGRVAFTYLRDYLGGSLLCTLPSGRCLTYRNMHWQQIDILDDDDKPTGLKEMRMTFARGYGRVRLWPGMFVENVTQAVAADVLRGTLAELGNDGWGWPVRLHTHDEVLVEVTEAEAETAAVYLDKIMTEGFVWSEGLPLKSEQTIAPYYTKQEI